MVDVVSNGRVDGESILRQQLKNAGRGHGFADTRDVRDEVRRHRQLGRVSGGAGQAAVSRRQAANLERIADYLAGQTILNVVGQLRLRDASLWVAGRYVGW